MDQANQLMQSDTLTADRPLVVGPEPNRTLTIMATPPRTRFAIAEKPKPRPRSQRRLSIRHVADHKMVALIELVSPSNKASKYKFKSFVEKAAGVLDVQIHLLVIDPFPPGKRDPNGIHGAIWEEVTGRSFTLPPEKPLTIASYSSGEEVSAYVEPVAVGDPLPDMPLFLEPDLYVNVPLEATYQTAWQTFPEEWKTVVAGV